MKSISRKIREIRFHEKFCVLDHCVTSISLSLLRLSLCCDKMMKPHDEANIWLKLNCDISLARAGYYNISISITKIFQIDIRGHEKFKSTAESLDKLLSATVPERTKSERSDSLLVSKISFDQVTATGFDRTQKSFIATIIIEANIFSYHY